MLRACFWSTSLVFVPLGVLLYFFPPALAQVLDISPMWLVRATGGLMLGWGIFLISAGLESSTATLVQAANRSKTLSLAISNLLLVATFSAALLKLPETGVTMWSAAHLISWLMVAWLLLWGLMALFCFGKQLEVEKVSPSISSQSDHSDQSSRHKHSAATGVVAADVENINTSVSSHKAHQTRKETP